MKSIRFAVVGCGSWAQETHIPFLLSDPDVELVGLVDVAADARRDELLGRFSPRFVTANLSDLLQKTAVDCAVISTPHATHFEIASEAIKNGLHVHVDKPLCCTADQINRLRRLANEHILVSTHTQRKYMVGHSIIREYLKAQFSEVYHISASIWQPEFDDFQGSWRATNALAVGGVLMDSGYHLVDSVLSLFATGSLVQVRDVCALMHNAQSSNDSFATLMFRIDQTVVQVNAFRGMPGRLKKEEFQILGNGGHIKMSYISGSRRKTCRVTFRSAGGKRPQSEKLTVTPWFRTEPLRIFLAAIRGDLNAKEVIRQNVNIAGISVAILEKAYAFEVLAR